MKAAFLEFVSLPDNVRAVYKIGDAKRLDLVRINNPIAYRGFDPLNNRTGRVSLRLTETRGKIDARLGRRAQYCLMGNNINLTSIYVENLETPQFAYGNPNKHAKLINGKLNPFYEYRRDLYLFRISPDYTRIEIVILVNEEPHTPAHFIRLIRGEYTALFDTLQAEAVPFYPYIGLS